MQFKLIMVFVDDERTEEVLDAARDAGATGATIIGNAQGRGLKPHLTFFGLEFMASRNVLLFLVEARRSDEILQAILQAGKLDESLQTGIALELDVARAVGLSAHIEALTKEHPIKPA
ncbi:MAG: P-II family nitrogen regulator [Halopseudomonas yangmingensis]|uniref:Nitrogen regulatory protein P-II family n=1 Tax=Halopseudomonas yangmingensis TaxID=1720063 RepID=A0A1I4T6T5_9GAMM|nr:P-II family nitrogen regulator [Halopseudomonas yangmingensis]SFM72488.1 nitrogen regulatory protein P-II family [Halopseudomonas yangmingensis]